MPSIEQPDATPQDGMTVRVEIRPAAPEDLSLAPEPEAARRSPMPQPGEIFQGFRIARELGRGAFGRVYLAHQLDLSERPVALKVSGELLGEVRKLARLQHTNIVPVYSVHRAENLQALCMPFFGATTLSHVLTELRSQGTQFPTGRTLVSTLHGARSMGDGEAVAETPPETFGSPHASETIRRLEAMSFTDAVLWIGSQVADGLAHAHERGLVHRDIKPGNILLTDDGLPMLLDFNLAEDRAAERARAGGTLPYMSPEQLAAFSDETVVIDGRSDVYSLGLILFQLLTRSYPFTHHRGSARESVPAMLDERRRLAPRVPGVSPAVEAIIRKCLEPDRDRRYQSAGDLKEDVDLHLADCPLRHAPNPSRRERFAKWCRRHPRLVSPITLAAAAATVLLCLTAVGVSASLESRARAEHAQRQQARADFDAFLGAAERAKAGSLGDPDQIAEANRVGTEALERYGVFEPGWEEGPGVALLPEADRHRLKGEVGELALLLAWSSPQSAQRLLPAARANTTDAETRFEYVRAFEHASKGEFAAAMPLVKAFVERFPDDFGAWDLKARCHEQLGQLDDALAAYGQCITLRPTYHRAYAARATLWQQRKNPEQAKADYDRALTLAPGFLDARLNRALLLSNMRRYPEALADLDIALADENVPTRFWFVRATVRQRAGDKVGAKADRQRGMETEPSDLRSWVARGMAHEADRDYEKALDDLRAAERLAPSHAQPLLNQAFILGDRLGRYQDALEVTERLLAFQPDHENARAGRAVLLARLKKFDEAVKVARELADPKREPPVAPSTLYQAASALALAAGSDPQYRSEALRVLARALYRGYGQTLVLQDADFAALKSDAMFTDLINGVKLIVTFGQERKSRLE